jgi:transposase
MPRAYSEDLRGRVIEAVQGGASRREAAERFEISPSSAVKWVQNWEETGSTAPKPTGGSISPLEEHADLVFELVEEQPDLTLVEIVAALRKRRVVTSRSSVWRFFERHKLTFKKKFPRRGTRSGRCRPGASILAEEAAASRFDLSGVH